MGLTSVLDPRGDEGSCVLFSSSFELESGSIFPIYPPGDISLGCHVTLLEEIYVVHFRLESHIQAEESTFLLIKSCSFINQLQSFAISTHQILPLQF